LKIEPKHTINLSNYAAFLNNIRMDYDKAEEYYIKVLEIDPKFPINLGNYALFLNNIRKDYDKAEEYFKKALEIEPKNAKYPRQLCPILL